MDLTRRDLTASSIYLPLTTFVQVFDRKKNQTIDKSDKNEKSSSFNTTFEKLRGCFTMNSNEEIQRVDFRWEMIKGF